MQSRFAQLAISARRLVTHSPTAAAATGKRLTGRRQIASELTQFSFRLAFAIDLAYVGIGALGGAAIGRAVGPTHPPAIDIAVPSSIDTLTRPIANSR
jgi:hypothetical protein